MNNNEIESIFNAVLFFLDMSNIISLNKMPQND